MTPATNTELDAFPRFAKAVEVAEHLLDQDAHSFDALTGERQVLALKRNAVERFGDAARSRAICNSSSRSTRQP